LETYQTSINYQDTNNTWQPINTTLTPTNPGSLAYTHGYTQGNDHGPYAAYFKPNLQDTWPVAFAYNQSTDPTIHTIRTQLTGVGYLDPTSNWDYHILQTTQNSQAQYNGNTITYPGAFTGTDLTMSYGSDELKEALVLSNTTKAVLQSHPPSLYGLSNANSYLVVITKITAQNLALYNDTGPITGNQTITNTSITLKDILGDLKCVLPLGEAYSLNNDQNSHRLTYRIIHYNGDTYLLAGLKLTDLATMTYPVVIDPSITLYSSSNDGYTYVSNGNYNYAWLSLTGTVDSTSTSIAIGQNRAGSPYTYTIDRGYLYFNTSQLSSNAYIDTATLGLYKVADYSTTDFQITVQNGQPTYPHSPMQTGDYSKAAYSGNGGSLNTVEFTTGYNSLPLNTQGISWLNRTGWTKLCLRSSRDISGTSPTGSEYVTINSFEYPLTGHQPRLVIAYRNQSKIKDNGSTNIKGYLLIQVQYLYENNWITVEDVINETSPRTITVGNQLPLDTIFNGLMDTSDLRFGNGTYRVYAAFRDPNGDALICNDNQILVGYHEFHFSLQSHPLLWEELTYYNGFGTTGDNPKNVATRGIAIYPKDNGDASL
jgi:hypothetical protein